MTNLNNIRTHLRSMLQVTPRDHGFRATLHLNPAFPLFPDHFAGNPVFPGMCLVQAVLLAASMHTNQPDLRLASLKNAKFLIPALPNDTLLIDADLTPQPNHTLLIKANLYINTKRIAQITLLAHPSAGDPT